MFNPVALFLPVLQNVEMTQLGKVAAAYQDQPLGQGVETADIIVSAAIALLITVGGFYFQRREAKQREKELAQQQAQFQKQMEIETDRLSQEVRQKEEALNQQQQKLEIELTAFQERYSTPERRVLDWLDTLTHPEEEDLGAGGPYVVGPAIINPDNFYGRKELAKRFFDHVVRLQPTSVSLIGARRSGKTSFLYYVSHPNVLNLHLKNRRSITPVYLNLQANITNPERFYEYLVSQTMRVLERNGELQVPAPALPNPVDFTFVEKFFTKLCEARLRFILFLDEIESLDPDAGFDNLFFGTLRALATGQALAWVTTSYMQIDQVEARTGNNKDVPMPSPFFNIFDIENLHVGALTPFEAEQLVREPAIKAGHPFSEEDVNFVIGLAGRMPFALQACAFMLYRIHQEGQEGEAARKTARDRFRDAMKRHFNYYWQQFVPAERQALSYLAAGRDLSERDVAVLAGLERYGFVEKAGEDYAVLGSALGDWIHTIQPDS